MQKAVLCAASFFAASAWSVAGAAFHLWQVNEVYSSTDGTLQFVELLNHNDFENFISGHSVIASGGGPDRIFTFNSNLPTTATAEKTILIATPNFQSMTGLAPDYVLAGSDFLNVGGGSVLFDGSNSTINHGAFDGVSSFGPGGVPGMPTPQNFSGQTITLPEPSALGLLAISVLALRRR